MTSNGFQIHSFAMDEGDCPGALAEALASMTRAVGKTSASFAHMAGLSAAMGESFAKAKKAWMLDEGEELVARVLGHEYDAARDWCACGWLVGEDGHDRFSYHARAAIQAAEQELPKPFRPPPPLPPVLEAKRQRDAERRQRLEQLHGKWSS